MAYMKNNMSLQKAIDFYNFWTKYVLHLTKGGISPRSSDQIFHNQKFLSSVMRTDVVTHKKFQPKV